MAFLIGSPDADQVNGVSGEENTLLGDALFLRSGETGGNDQLTGGTDAGLNVIYGDALEIGDRIETGSSSRGGDDVVVSGSESGQSELIGDAELMFGIGIGGNDRLVSGGSDDEMWGDARTMIGNAVGGEDTFVFDADCGTDRIMDFEQGKDMIELRGFVSVEFPGSPKALKRLPAKVLEKFTVGQTFEDLDITEVDGDSVVTFDQSNSVTVVGVTGLDANDFIFVA